MSWLRLGGVRKLSRTSVSLAMADKAVIGKREIVGFGTNGQCGYVDSPMFPYPAIRYREINPQYKALKEKEKGDWRSLSLAEKKCLYRISFCQTFAEMEAPNGEWKSIWGSALMIMAFALTFQVFRSILAPHHPPGTLTEELQVAQLKRMIDMKTGPIFGLTSAWDYENGTWKK